MKTTWLAITTIVLMSACGNESLEQLKKENTALKREAQKQDSLMNELVIAFSAVDQNIKLIRQKEDTIQQKLNDKIAANNKKAIILEQVNAINALVAQNESLVDRLESGLSRDTNQVLGMNEILSSLKEKNETESGELNGLKIKLVTISNDFKGLFEEFIDAEVERMQLEEGNLTLRKGNQNLLEGNQALLENNKILEKQLYTGWYIVGTKSELKLMGLLDKKGVLDLKRLNRNFDKKYFKRVNVREFKTLKLNVKKATLITTHPTNSYELTGGKKKIEKLLIHDSIEFWSVSKYLLIQIEK